MLTVYVEPLDLGIGLKVRNLAFDVCDAPMTIRAFQACLSDAKRADHEEHGGERKARQYPVHPHGQAERPRVATSLDDDKSGEDYRQYERDADDPPTLESRVGDVENLNVVDLALQNLTEKAGRAPRAS